MTFLLYVILFLASGVLMAESRIALVIGNGSYPDAPLKNPLNDARDMENLLESFDFEVTRLENASLKRMQRAVGDFSRELGKGTVGFFYYAGHGLQVEGRNYLIPVDADIQHEADVPYEAMALNRLLDGMRRAGGGLNLVVLDACRDNPYIGSSRSLARGFARASPTTTGTMIMYATEPGEVAEDGQGKNGVFTGEFIRAVNESPELKIEELFKLTTRNVRSRTKQQQTPWSEGNILGDFAFVARNKLLARLDASQAIERPVSNSLELLVWEEAKQGNTIPYYQAYLKQFPNGAASELAKLKINELVEQQRLARESAEALQLEQAAAESLAIKKARQNKIEQLIERTRQHIAALRLTSPVSDNATKVLEELETTDPGNEFVEQGRAQIREQYIDWIESRIAGGNLEKAEEYLRSLSIVPESERDLNRLQLSIRNSKDSAARKLLEEKAIAEQALTESLARQRREEQFLEQTAEAQRAEEGLSISRTWRRGIQVALNEAGLNAGLADGIWGAKTRASIRNWQILMGLPATGYLRRSDYKLLIEELGAQEVFVVEDEKNQPEDVLVSTPATRSEFTIPEMVKIKGGKYKVGNLSSAAVSIDTFEIGKYEVTVSQFRQFLDASGYKPDAMRNAGGVKGCNIWRAASKEWVWTNGSGTGFHQTDDHPVTCVSWNDSQAYVKWLNTVTSDTFRLPGEAEWELAASAGTTSDWSFQGGKRELCSYGNGADKATESEFYWSNNCNDRYKRTAPVGKFKQNGNQLFDVHGNVGEWVEDCWHSTFEGIPKNGIAWTDKCNRNKRVMRGGSWYHGAAILQTKHRYWFDKNYRDSTTGFRVAR